MNEERNELNVDDLLNAVEEVRDHVTDKQIDWLDESYVERVAKECNMNLMYDDDGDYYDANVEDVVKFAQKISKAAIQSKNKDNHE